MHRIHEFTIRLAQGLEGRIIGQQVCIGEQKRNEKISHSIFGQQRTFLLRQTPAFASARHRGWRTSPLPDIASAIYHCFNTPAVRPHHKGSVTI